MKLSKRARRGHAKGHKKLRPKKDRIPNPFLMFNGQTNDAMVESALTALMSARIGELLIRPVVKKWLKDRPEDTAPTV